MTARQSSEMRTALSVGFILLAMCLGGYLAVLGGSPGVDEPEGVSIPTPTGKMITPTAAKGAIFQDLDPGHTAAPDLRASHAAALSVSPDGQMLAILTSGYNRHFGKDGKPVPELSTEYVFVFDISRPQPKQLQVLPIPNAFQGLAWAPSSDRLFASGGKDDSVLEIVRDGLTFKPARIFRLEHRSSVGLSVELPDGSNLDTTPMAGGVAVSPDGTRLLVTNFQNDSASLIDLKSGHVATEQDLRPGIIDPKRRGEPGGSFPRCVTWSSTDHAYVGSERDREIISLAIDGVKIRVVRRIPLHGQPVALLANRQGSRVYVALDNTDRVGILDTVRDTAIEELNVVAPEAVYPNAGKLGGANSNGLALTPDEHTLLVSNGGENAIAVVRLGTRATGTAIDHRQDRDGDDGPQADVDQSAVIGLVPTGWYPVGVAISKDGATWYVANGKSPTGPNIGWCHRVDPTRKTCVAENPPGERFAENGQMLLHANDEATLQMQKAGFLTVPAPPAVELARLTKQVAHNNRFDQVEKTAADKRLFSFLRDHIKHVIYVVKENRSYDQVLGDLEVGNGDPRLAIFPEKISPNHHAIARNFSTLDNFLVSGEGSWTGWDWTVAARTSDFAERSDPLWLANRGFIEGYFGTNRNINMGLATSAERTAENSLSPADPDILPGARDVDGLDGPGGEQGKGYIWDAALRRGLTVRNYGVFGDFAREFATPPKNFVRDPFAQHAKVFFPTNISLMPFTDRYYRSFNPAFPDYWRYQEWKREFDGFSASKVLPDLMFLWLGEDHTGSYGQAIDGVNTPETQMADNDYAFGMIVEAVAHSPFANDTLIISVEDDTWDGPDHVNSFRSVNLFAGPYVRQHAVVSTRYTTVNVVKTIEEILDIGPIGLNDELAAPMSDVFDSNATTWSYKAIVPEVLYSTKLPLPPADHATNATPRRSAAYWAKAMAGQDFSGPDRVDPLTFNRALWRGLKGEEPFPAATANADLRKKREQVLAKAQPAGGKNDRQ